MGTARLDSALGFVSGPSVSVWFMTSVLEFFLSDEEQRFNSDMILGYGPYVDQNRNQLVETFFQLDRDWLFMVDNDMIFKPEDVWALYEVADEKGPGIYAGPYMQENSVLTCGPWDDVAKLKFRHLKGLPSKPTQVGVVGTGFTLIHRDVLVAVGNKPFSTISDVASEDVAFCSRAHVRGFDPWIVPNSNPGHFKQVVLYTDGMRNAVGDEINLVAV